MLSALFSLAKPGRIGTRKNAGSKVSYQRYYDDPRRDDRRNYNQRTRPVAGFEFDDIIFDNRGDADLVLDQLESAIANYGMASVLDLYDLAGLTCQNYMADKYGWTDIQSARVARTRDGYILQLPRATKSPKRGAVMYGYFVSSGYRGFVDGTWMLFPTESEYYEYMKELEN